MNKLKQPALRKLSVAVKTCLLIAVSLGSATVNADALNLKETQTEKLKCVSQKNAQGVKVKVCTKTSVGTYNITAQIALKTLMDKGLDVFALFGAGIPQDTPLGLSLGDMEFSGTLAGANKKGKTSGTWYTNETLCLKTDANSQCLKSKLERVRTISINGNIGGVIIKVTGKSDGIQQVGESVFANTCAETGSGMTTQTGTVTIASFTMQMPVNLTCKVAKTSKSMDGATPVELVNMNITGKLGSNP